MFKTGVSSAARRHRTEVKPRSKPGRGKAATTPRAAPASYAALSESITARYESLRGQMRQIARVATERPTHIALHTVAEIARAASVQPSSVVRFAQSFGYPGFGELQAIFRSRLIEQSSSYGDRIEALRAERSSRHLSGPEANLIEFVDDGVAGDDLLGGWPNGALAQPARATGIATHAMTIVTPRRMRPR
jgi:hypothetical protein